MGYEQTGEMGRSMSMPRKAMKEMGFQICCLLCDAPDVAGTKRCRKCISRHVVLRDGLPDNPKSPIEQFALELMQMISNPQRLDHDEIHGKHLRQYQLLAGDYADTSPLPTSEEIDGIFDRQRRKPEKSLIKDVANQNPWKDRVPSPEGARAISEDISPIDGDESVGRRTIPSREIDVVDRSDRLGEDRQLSDRVAAAERVADLPKDKRGEAMEGEIAKREGVRAVWEDTIEDLEELLEVDEPPADDENDLDI